MNLKAIKYWSPYLNELKDLIEQIPDYEKLNIYELYDEFVRRYNRKPAIEMLIASRHFIHIRIFVEKIEAKVYDRKVSGEGIHYLVKIDEKRRERIKEMIKEKDLFSLFMAGIELPTDSLRNVYYLSNDNTFRSVKEKKVLKKLYQREPEVLVYVFDDIIISRHDRANISILPNPETDFDNLQILYVEDPILIEFVKRF